MTYAPANPQFLAPAQTAPEGSPQTQFVVPAADGPEVASAAATAAMEAYEAADKAGTHPIPPAGVYTGAGVDWHPASTLLS